MIPAPDNPTEVLQTLDRELDHEVGLVCLRPHAVDLILTKMMRGNDPQDMEDIAFIVRISEVTAAEMENGCAQVRIPDLSELRDAFEKALPTVREILLKNGQTAG